MNFIVQVPLNNFIAIYTIKNSTVEIQSGIQRKGIPLKQQLVSTLIFVLYTLCGPATRWQLILPLKCLPRFTKKVLRPLSESGETTR